MKNSLKLSILLLIILLIGCAKEGTYVFNLKILFITRNIEDKDDLHSYLYLMNTYGTELTKIINLPVVYWNKPVVSNNYDKIAFICEDDSWVNKLYVVNIKGDNLKLIDTSHNRYTGTPSWSEDDSKITYSKKMSESPYYTSVFLYDFKNSLEYQLTDSGNCYDPKFSPDGKIISYTCGFKLYLMDVNGSNKRLIVPNIVWDYNWSPKGNKIVYSGKDENKSEQIYLLELSGNSIKKLTDSYYKNPDTSWLNYGNQKPQCTPDGNKIVYESDINEDKSGIYIMDIEGNNKKRLSLADAGDVNPVVSPDGGKIMFLSHLYGSGSYAIKIMDINGENQKSLSNNRHTDNFPSFIKND